MTKLKICISLILTTIIFCSFCACSARTSNTPALLVRDDWSSDVKTAINDLLVTYGNTSDNYIGNEYAVFDFDNTSSIFDMCEQFIIYQIDYMAFALTPEQLPLVLSSGLGDMDKDLSNFGYGKGSYNDWIYDINKAYTALYSKYGPFTAKGVNEETSKALKTDPQWLEFSVKMIVLYELIGDNESTNVAYPWITYWYTGMTQDEVYSIASKSHEKYRNVNTEQVTVETSKDIESKVGVVSHTYTLGVQVTDNIVELWKALDENGIDVWVCSASDTDIIRAAIDVFGLHDYCSGLIGMTPQIIDGKISYKYDYESGLAWLPNENGIWVHDTIPTNAQTQAEGKVTAIKNVCVSRYNCGPIACFCDSTGDFNFCTEFSDTKLVVCFNRASRKVTEGGGLIAEVAMYQKDTLGYDLQKANEAGDTLYVLQGRDENKLRTLRNSNKTIRFNSNEETLFADKNNNIQLQYMIDNNMTTAEAFNTFAIKTKAVSPENKLGFDYGFLEEYSGYHSISF